MELVDLQKDNWRIIGRYLSKGDLLALQVSSSRLQKLLDRIPEIWWGKHNDAYREMWKVHYNNQKPTKQQKALYTSFRCYCSGKYKIEWSVPIYCETKPSL